jgi:hypothetical protein
MAGILASLMETGWMVREVWMGQCDANPLFRRRNKYLIVCWKAGPCMSLFDIASPCWV